MTGADRMRAKIGGALVLGSLGFVAAFGYLAATFGYPQAFVPGSLLT